MDEPLNLDTPLDSLTLTARARHYCERAGHATVRDLSRVNPRTLLAARNMGRKTLAELLALVESARQNTAKELSEPATTSDEEPTPHEPPNTWNWLSRWLPPALRETELSTLHELPARMLSYASREGITTLGQLVDQNQESLRSSANLGRQSIAVSLQWIVQWALAEPARLQARTLEHYPSLSALVRAQIGPLEPIKRMVLQHRAGIETDACTLQELGEMLAVTRERVRQLEARAIRDLLADGWWVPLVTEQLDALLPSGMISCTELASRAPWFAMAQDEPEFFAFVCKHFLAQRFKPLKIPPDRYITTFAQSDFDTAWQTIHQRFARAHWPQPVHEVIAQILEVAAPMGAGAGELLQALARKNLVAHDDLHTFVGYSGTRDRELRIWLEKLGRPASVSEITDHFGRGRLPDDVVFVQRGLVTTPSQLPGFASWTEKLAARCVAHMTQRAPQRQWSSAELAPILQADGDLPSWFGVWPLAGMLAQSGLVRYLGRGVVTLPEVEGERLHLRTLFSDLLGQAAGPLPIETLLERARSQRAIGQFTLQMILGREPFVELQPGIIGLLARDLPGGPSAAADATQWIVEMLETRACGLSLANALSRLQSHAELYDPWTPTMLRSVCRHDDRIHSNVSGALGLAEWDDVRMPTRTELFTRALSEPGGRASVRALSAQVEALYGEPLSRRSLTAMAWHHGASIAGDDIVAASVSDDPDSLSLAGLSMPLSRRLSQLMSEPAIAISALRETTDQHSQRFFREAIVNEDIDLAVTQEAQRRCHTLLDRAETCNPEQRTMIQAAVRYFILDDDDAWDFARGGLDDDLAVLIAVEAATEMRSPGDVAG
ncbi:MAG: DNA-directed RNA polymerase subunit alpha C-terminal domain-containing protein [Deltaproteobacteria bacterium]|nr:DNA-directed RNA polymerase subunit alpha C-terminal domain-containing protein [Deltaproteobacteria bacterium]